MFLFSPVLKGMCTVRELKEYYSIDEVADMVEAIEVENYYLSKARDPNSALGKKEIVING